MAQFEIFEPQSTESTKNHEVLSLCNSVFSCVSVVITQTNALSENGIAKQTLH